MNKPFELKESQLYAELDRYLSFNELDLLRQEFNPIIRRVEDHIKNSPKFEPLDEYIISVIGVKEQSRNVFPYPLGIRDQDVQVITREFNEYWINTYINPEADYEFRVFIPKFDTIVSEPVRTLFNEIAHLLNRPTMGTEEKTITLLRTPPQQPWFNHVDVMPNKVLIPLFSDNAELKFYDNQDNEIDSVRIKEGKLYINDAKVPHQPFNYSHNARWIITLEEPFYT